MEVINGCMYQTWTGMARGIWLVRTGNLIDSFLYPKNDPKKTRGTDTQNHRKSRVKKDVNGSAPDEPSIHRTRFRRPRTAKVIPG